MRKAWTNTSDVPSTRRCGCRKLRDHATTKQRADANTFSCLVASGPTSRREHLLVSRRVWPLKECRMPSPQLSRRGCKLWAMAPWHIGLTGARIRGHASTVPQPPSQRLRAMDSQENVSPPPPLPVAKEQTQKNKKSDYADSARIKLETGTTLLLLRAPGSRALSPEKQDLL